MAKDNLARVSKDDLYLRRCDILATCVFRGIYTRDLPLGGDVESMILCIRECERRLSKAAPVLPAYKPKKEKGHEAQRVEHKSKRRGPDRPDRKTSNRNLKAARGKAPPRKSNRGRSAVARTKSNKAGRPARR